MALPGVSSDLRYSLTDIPMKIFSVIQDRALKPRSNVVSVMVSLLLGVLRQPARAAG